MNHPAKTLRARAGHALWLSGALFALMATNDDNGCAPDVPDPGEQAECTVATDCKGDPGVDCVGEWQCVAGACEFECGTTPSGCYSDRDCDEGLVCNAAEVCLTPPGCAEGQPCPDVCYGECVKPTAPTACTSSESCPDGQHCSTEDGVCNSNCPPGMACPAVCWGECTPNQVNGVCYADSECGFGEYCDRDPCVFPGATPADSDAARPACGGVCTAKETCQSDADCGADEYCGCAPYDGTMPVPNGLIPCFMQCLPKEGACNWDGDCKEGLVCEAGRCIEPKVECTTADQCPRGWSCEMQCGGTEPSPDPDSSGAPAEDRFWCPSYCVPPVVVCGEEGFVCAPGQHCETVCYAECPPCDCGPNEDCACPCTETCKSACVDDQPQTCGWDGDCPPGTYCGCAWNGTDASGEADVMCQLQCLPLEPTGECYSDAECKDGYFCNMSWCGAPMPECDPADASCAGRPALPCPGFCEAKPVECTSDLECGEGSYCEYEVCAAGTPDGDPITTCWGHCKPRQPEYDCKSDANCIDAAGNQGYCEFQMCESWAVPCSSDDPNCGMMPPAEVCYGFCRYEQPQTCSPWEDTCPAGTHCESTGSCAGGPGFGIPCLMEYQCVPDAVPACLNDCDCGFGFACVNGACQVQEPVGMCDANFACKDGYTCGCPDWRGDMGVACFPQCYADKVCEPTYCWDGVCPDGYTCKSDCGATPLPNGLVICPAICVKEEVPACASDCDCDPALACNNGVCERMGRINTCYVEPTNCGSDAECAAGEYCHITAWDEICPACVDCPCTVIPRGTCEPIVDVRKCESDADCAAGEYCGCGSDPSCPMCDVCLFQCLPKAEPGSCKEDLDCGAGQVCTFYYPPCACPVDENGNYADCSWCQPIGVCEDKPVVPTDCKQDADCGAGMRCEQNPCPSFMPCGPEGCPSCGGQCVPVEEPTSCVRTGCSGQVCAGEDVATTCEWRDWYQCYRYAICDADAAGVCGWQKTDEFIRCMEQYGGFTP